ncbi:MAG: retropepsin-like aspartic protease, partial [Vulcanimicrobiaceae bacterium]
MPRRKARAEPAVPATPTEETEEVVMEETGEGLENGSAVQNLNVLPPERRQESQEGEEGKQGGLEEEPMHESTREPTNPVIDTTDGDDRNAQAGVQLGSTEVKQAIRRLSQRRDVIGEDDFKEDILVELDNNRSFTKELARRLDIVTEAQIDQAALLQEESKLLRDAIKGSETRFQSELKDIRKTMEEMKDLMEAFRHAKQPDVENSEKIPPNNNAKILEEIQPKMVRGIYDEKPKSRGEADFLQDGQTLHGYGSKLNPVVLDHGAANTIVNRVMSKDSVGGPSMRMKPPTWSGQLNGESLDTWIYTFTQAGQMNSWTNDQCRLYAPAYFRGYASTWYQETGKYAATWSDLLDAMRKEFESEHVKNTALKQIKSRKQKIDESVEIYFKDMLALREKCGSAMSQNEFMTTLKGGLLAQYWDAINSRNFDTPLQLMGHLQEAEAAKRDKRAQKSKVFAVTEEKKAEVQCKPTEREEILFSKLDELIKTMQATRRPYVGNRVNRQTRDSDGRPICFNCQKSGHISRDCPSPRQQTVNRKKFESTEKVNTIGSSVDNSRGLTTITLNVEGRSIQTILDSASTINIISGNLLKTLSNNILCTRKELFTTALASNNLPLDTSLGQYELPVEIEGKTFTFTVVAIPQFPYDVLLGTPVLKNHETSLKFKDETFEIDGVATKMWNQESNLSASITMHIRLTEPVEIPAQSEVITNAKGDWEPSLHVAMVEQADKLLEKKGIMVARSVITMNSGIVVRMYNSGDLPVKLGTGKIVAKAQVMDTYSGIRLVDSNEYATEVGTKMTSGKHQNLMIEESVQHDNENF